MGEEVYYQAYFRTKRGGVGIEYDTARYELLACLGPRATLRNEWPGRFRVAFDWGGSATDLLRLSGRLGYTQAVLRVRSTPWDGAEPDFAMAERWPVGRITYKGRDLELAELWVADEDERLARSPHVAGFEFESAPGDDVSGPRLNRRLSPLDARLVANICGLPDGARVLDPFAGLGAIARAALERGLRCWVSDVDPDLTPGLRERFAGRAILADARCLPFPSECVDGVLAEPPYHRRDRSAVVESLPELARVTRRGGVAVLLVADWMKGHVADGEGWRCEAALPVRRHGIECTALVWRRT